MGFRIFPSRLGFSHKFKSLIASFQEERKKAKIIKERLENMYKFVIHLLRVKMKDEKREELIALRIETDLLKRLKKIAREDERSVSSLIRMILKKYLKEENK